MCFCDALGDALQVVMDLCPRVLADGADRAFDLCQRGDDVVGRAGVDPADVTVITGQEMIWPDGSLGCAEPGGIYTQALVPGYWVIVEAGGAAYDYRLSDKGNFRLCESPFGGPGTTVPSS